MPPETNNPTDPVIDDGANEEWARWEQTFRDARPVLPEAAIARIESSIRRETNRLAVERPRGGPRRVWLWIAAIIATGVIGVSLVKYRQSTGRDVRVANPVEKIVRVRDQYPLDLPIEPAPTTRPDTGPRALTQLVVEARSKSVQEGVATYSGPVQISAGPWRIECDRLTVFHGASHGVLLSGVGAIQIHGVSGIMQATADELTMDTENGDLKLSGHVKLDSSPETRQLQSCTISRTGNLRDVQP